MTQQTKQSNHQCRSLRILEEAKNDAVESYDKTGCSSYNKQVIELTEALENPVAFAMDILRHEMADKAEGSLYHSWVCNIKWAVYDNIMSDSTHLADHPYLEEIQKACEQGAIQFMDLALRNQVK